MLTTGVRSEVGGRLGSDLNTLKRRPGDVLRTARGAANVYPSRSPVPKARTSRTGTGRPVRLSVGGRHGVATAIESASSILTGRGTPALPVRVRTRPSPAPTRGPSRILIATPSDSSRPRRRSSTRALARPRDVVRERLLLATTSTARSRHRRPRELSRARLPPRPAAAGLPSLSGRAENQGRARAPADRHPDCLS
jgi:hypothetical protein